MIISGSHYRVLPVRGLAVIREEGNQRPTQVLEPNEQFLALRVQLVGGREIPAGAYQEETVMPFAWKQVEALFYNRSREIPGKSQIDPFTFVVSYPDAEKFVAKHGYTLVADNLNALEWGMTLLPLPVRDKAVNDTSSLLRGAAQYNKKLAVKLDCGYPQTRFGENFLFHFGFAPGPMGLEFFLDIFDRIQITKHGVTAARV